jgi:hypothetical protein
VSHELALWNAELSLTGQLKEHITLRPDPTTRLGEFPTMILQALEAALGRVFDSIPNGFVVVDHRGRGLRLQAVCAWTRRWCPIDR